MIFLNYAEKILLVSLWVLSTLMFPVLWSYANVLYVDNLSIIQAMVHFTASNRD